MAHGTFATTINCIDGRAQGPVSQWIRDNFHVDYVDTVTAPGVDDIIAERSDAEIQSIVNAAAVSINAHHSGLVVLAGHANCAGNPVSDTEHAAHIKKACDRLSGLQWPVRVIGVWVNHDWQIEKICDSRPQ